jgi:L-ascorbate metabolism protein UlaG (beta-lactamase superfamily)
MVEVMGAAAGAKEVRGAKHTVYFGGDSAKTDYWAEIGAMFPDIDIAMLGIGAYKPDYMMEAVHSDPAEAFKGYLDLGAKFWWPMHHGTYDLSNEPASEPIQWAERLMGEAGALERLLQPAVNSPYYLESLI